VTITLGPAALGGYPPVWRLVREKAEALRVSMSQIVTDEAQFVDGNGNVFMHGKLVGKTGCEVRPGWSSWGAEAAGPPFSIPSMARELEQQFKMLRKTCPHCNRVFCMPVKKTPRNGFNIASVGKGKGHSIRCGPRRVEN
jgi:hypothetical protein